MAPPGASASTQHLANALAPIRAEGGLAGGADRIVPRLLLVGRDGERLQPALRRPTASSDWTTDLDAALAKPDFPIFFDAAATQQRVAALTKAIAAGKHIYSEKPVAPSVAEGLALLHAAQARGLKAGAVEDKLHLPGIAETCRRWRKSGFFGRVTGFPARFRLVDFRRRASGRASARAGITAQGGGAHHGYGTRTGAT